MVYSTTTELSTRLITTGDPERWRSILPASRSVFGSVEFCSTVERFQDTRPALFVFSQGQAEIAYPFFLRGVEDLPYDWPVDQGWDIKSPEYTGPIPLHEVTPDLVVSFRKSFHRFCTEAGIIAEFAHIHPWEGNLALLDPAGIHLDRQITYVDLSLNADRMWNEFFSHACRKNINRAKQENVRVFPAQNDADIQEFHRIYIETMQRNQAASHYYFPLDYFKGIMEALPNHALMLMAAYQDRIVAGTLYLHDDRNIYSYLGGADRAFQRIRPTNMVIYEAIRWGQAQGKRRLILGGGYRPDDGIARFKASFSPLKADFYTYRSVHLQDQYQILCQAWSAYYDAPPEEDHYFPLYRSVLPQYEEVEK